MATLTTFPNNSTRILPRSRVTESLRIVDDSTCRIWLRGRRITVVVGSSPRYYEKWASTVKEGEELIASLGPVLSEVQLIEMGFRLALTTADF